MMEWALFEIQEKMDTILYLYTRWRGWYNLTYFSLTLIP